MLLKPAKFLLVFLLLTGTSEVQSNVKPNSLFSDNLVLQRGVEVPVWGWAGENEKVTVEFNGQTVLTTTIRGKWMVKLKPMKEGGPFTMTIKGENTVLIKIFLWAKFGFVPGNRIWNGHYPEVLVEKKLRPVQPIQTFGFLMYPIM
jgi:hypothetical protein